MRNAIETINHKGYKIEVYTDDDPQNPIKDQDMLGTFTAFHKRYDLSCSKNEFTKVDDFTDFIHEHRNKLVMLPLRVYEHSGITISTVNAYPYNDRWDSSYIGYVWVTYETIRKEYGYKHITKKVIEKIENILRDEVKLFDDYLTGNVYGYAILDKNNNEIDSCWGYYGDYRKDMIAECRSIVDHRIKQTVQNHVKELKKYIINKIPLIYRKSLTI